MESSFRQRCILQIKRQIAVLVFVLGITIPAFAGKIYGSITEGGKPVAQGVKIEVTCGSETYSAQTDAYGAFNLFAKAQGKCVLKVAYQGQTPSIEVNSYEGSVGYDLILDKQSGQYTLKRK
jgi:hypothetical protein